MDRGNSNVVMNMIIFVPYGLLTGAQILQLAT
jgi:hypothetical protein